MQKIAIGIPIYKENLSIFEKIALNQVDKILGRYIKIFIAPQSLKFDYKMNYSVIRFDDDYFRSTESYSDLLTSIEFYEAFSQYEYLLIYQLDAFVFYDNLEKICSYNYDYIGAPLRGGDWSQFHVGNGGLSLRNISKCAKIVRSKEKIIKDLYIEMNPTVWAEDLFWGYCGKRKDINFKVPSPKFAAEFSVQTDCAKGMRKIKERGLPFGCHYWWRTNYNFWKPYIEGYGYKLPPMETPDSMKSDEIRRFMYLIKRSARVKREKGINISRKYSVYGAGIWGKRCLKWFDELQVKIECVYDKNFEYSHIGTVPVVYPSIDKLSNCDSYIIIATLKYAKGIKEILNAAGLKENRDYCSLYDFCRKMINDNCSA